MKKYLIILVIFLFFSCENDTPEPEIELCEVDYSTLHTGINTLTSHYQPMNIPFVDYAKALDIELSAYGTFTLWSSFGNFNNNDIADYVIVATGGESWEDLPPGEITVIVDDSPKFIINNPQSFTRKVSIYDLNKDGIDDIVLFGHGPEFGNPWPGDKNVVIYIFESSYEIEEIGRNGFHHGGSVGALSENNISILQLNSQAFITDVEGYLTMMTNTGNGWIEENTNITTLHISRTYQSELFDFNKDGNLDLILGGHEWEESWMSSSPRPVLWQNHILLGLGDGQFDVDNPILLPQISNWGVITDFDIYDLDNDGLEEIIVTRTTGKEGAGSNLIEGEFYDGIKIQLLKANGNSWYEWKRLESPDVTSLHFPWAHKTTVYDVNKDCLLDIVPENDKFNASSFVPFASIRGIYYEQQSDGSFLKKYKE